MKNKMTDLRNHLFATLEALQDEDRPMEVERALAIAKVGNVLVESAKVEVQFVNVMGEGAKTTGFIESRPELQAIGGGK